MVSFFLNRFNKDEHEIKMFLMNGVLEWWEKFQNAQFWKNIKWILMCYTFINNRK